MRDVEVVRWSDMQAMILRQSRVLGFALLMAAAGGCGGGGGGKSAQANPGNGSQNLPPTIQGQPLSSVAPGQTYSFQPSANDANGDTLTFTASNLPRWATFNSATGRISGTPTSADVATYSGISIAASDGSASATLGPFSITVSDVGTGVATVSWMPPTQNADGSTLTDLAGYEVQYGLSVDNLDQRVFVNNPSVSSYVVENLTSGTWYFAVVSVTVSGAYSEPSNTASKTIT